MMEVGLVIFLYGMRRLALGLGGTHGRGRGRGEQIMGVRSWDPMVLGKEGETDVYIGLGKVVDW